VGALAVRASSRRGLAPFSTGLIAASDVVAGKFWLDTTAITYAGVGLLVFASIWNARPRRANTCSCLPADAGATK
jgi:hypothetical protein